MKKKHVPWTSGNQHKEYDMAEWRRAVGDSETVLGYDDWVEHQLESDRHDKRPILAEITVVYPVIFKMKVPANLAAMSPSDYPEGWEDKIKERADLEMRESAMIQTIHNL